MYRIILKIKVLEIVMTTQTTTNIDILKTYQKIETKIGNNILKIFGNRKGSLDTTYE